MLSNLSKLVLMFLGLLAGVLVVLQLFISHPHLPYMASLVTLVYILFSIWVMTSVPTRPSELPPPRTVE
jgi:NhaP-type Na+/H+ and K+/H+ antiporter